MQIVIRSNVNVNSNNSNSYNHTSINNSTLRPFQTAVSFPTDGEGMLVAMELMISQEGRDCKLYVRLSIISLYSIVYYNML